MWGLKIYQKYIPLCSQWDLYSVCVVYEKKAHLAFNNFCLTLISKLSNYSGWIDNNSRVSKKSNKTKRTDFFEKKVDEKKIGLKKLGTKKLSWKKLGQKKLGWKKIGPKKIGPKKNWAEKNLGQKNCAEKNLGRKILAEKILAIYWLPHPQGHATIQASSSFLKKLQKYCLD